MASRKKDGGKKNKWERKTFGLHTLTQTLSEITTQTVFPNYRLYYPNMSAYHPSHLSFIFTTSTSSPPLPCYPSLTSQPLRPLCEIYKYGFPSTAVSRISDQINQSKSDMFPWPDGWALACEVLMSVGTSISSLHERHSLPSGEQLEPEERKTSPVSPGLSGSGSRQC